MTRTASTVPAATRSPPIPVEQVVRRMRVTSIVFAGLALAGWLLPNLFFGHLDYEFQHFFQWFPNVLIITASLAVFAVASFKLVTAASLATIWLIYMVVVCYGISFAQYWGAFVEIDSGYIGFDRVGLSPVVVAMFFLSLLVPNRPRAYAVALLACASAPPVTYALSVQAGEAPAVDVLIFFNAFILPYLMCALAAYLGVRILYRLSRDLKRAREMGSYRLDNRLGVGGMGEVWLARHNLLARPAAIKLIRPDILGSSREEAGTTVSRFEREAHVIASLQSPHTVALYDFGTSADGALYYVMEMLEGLDLDTLVRKFGPLPPDRIVFLLLQACHSLAEAHQLGLIHRDIKPANLFICRQGLDCDFVKVLDFGLVTLQSGSKKPDARLTADGIVAGTPAFLPPEIASGGEVDGRADLYALGCVAYWLLTGRTVFEARNAVELIVAHATKKPVPPSKVSEIDIPRDLEQIVMDCLQKSPDQRPGSAQTLADRLAAADLPRKWTNDRATEWWNRHQPTSRNTQNGDGGRQFPDIPGD